MKNECITSLCPPGIKTLPHGSLKHLKQEACQSLPMDTFRSALNCEYEYKMKIKIYYGQKKQNMQIYQNIQACCIWDNLAL
ncbi:hypothetical protein T4B_12635 [Trichinella pseudospiralis]|uniref:Uncharacterized protein n=1 Tax=Trichinella pseudospiralis TaxID=6337 RepID=A0A0V1IRP0_TRIPS|nr:hypothetical protein T4B_12635 [Trichinella pseudospiralis]KRZ32351.1 hypothetical protein T4C_9777 [Trichinella pseudospiralis]